MTEIKETGGARIGMANATWPFATLKVTQTSMQLNASIIGSLVFKPSDIVSIELYSGFMSSGIKINHNVPRYKKHVVFWTMGGAAELIRRIENIGFLSNQTPIEKEVEQKMVSKQSQGGFPIKTSAAIAIVVIWNIFLLTDFIRFFGNNKDGSPLGLGAQLGLGFVLLTCLLLLTFKPARQLILKEGRTIDEIRRFIYFIIFVSSFMLINILVWS